MEEPGTAQWSLMGGMKKPFPHPPSPFVCRGECGEFLLKSGIVSCTEEGIECFPA